MNYRYQIKDKLIKIQNLCFRLRNSVQPIKKRVKINIVPYNGLDDQTKKQIDKTFKKVYGKTLEEHTNSWAKPNWIALGSINNKIVCLRYVLQTTVLFDNEEINIAGTGGLLTLPAYRHMGIGRKFFIYVDNFILNELQIKYGLLICDKSLVSYYKSMGWNKAKCQLYYYPDGSKKKMDEFCVMLKTANNQLHPNKIIVNGKLW